MPELPRSVLVAVDFGSASARAVALGGFIGTSCGAGVRLLHAETVEAPPYFTSQQIDALERQRQASRNQAQQYLLKFGRRHTNASITAVIDDRPPVDAILHDALSADLVVMGTHGRHGPRRWWLGSVAERVLREVAQPLLIVRADMAQPGESLFARALVHAAAPLTGAGTLEYARLLTARCGGEVFDGRREAIEQALDRTHATILMTAVPHPRTASWQSAYGEPLVRFGAVPMLFVPETVNGASS